ncbi:uncharacterized protein J3R85_014838 [Psidium guajava]|nr:uncharacterized protein J3R85_014838 [Psidium guajava]
MTGEAIWPSGVSRGNGDDNGANSSGSDAENMKLPPIALPFTAAPTFFLSLHLKLLMNHSVSKISFVELNQEKSAENASIWAQPNIATHNCSQNDMGFHTSQEAPSRESPCDKYLCCAKDDQAVELVVCKGADSRTPQDNQSGNLHTGRIRIATAVDGDEVGQMQEGQGNNAVSEKKSSPLQRITNGACPSLNGDIPHYNESEKPVDDGSLRSLPPTDMA